MASEEFGVAWSRRNVSVVDCHLRMRLARLHRLVQPAGVTGAARSAGVDDVELVGMWRAVFVGESGEGPMFSARRCRRCSITSPVGIREGGARRYLPSSALGPAGINQVRRQLNKAVREGRAQDCVEEVSRRVSRLPRCVDIVRVEIVRGRFDLDRCLLERTVRGTETVIAVADVQRSPDAGARQSATHLRRAEPDRSWSTARNEAV